MVHVNGKKVGGNANICKFTAYVSPYFVVSNGGAYTKHIYAASQRIASKLGNEDGFGADPRRVEMAGGKKISDIQKDNIGARYKELGFTYSAPEKEKVEKDSTMDSEEEEKLIFFYHPDHLGSTSYVTDADGNIAQHIEYIPYGEVFVEERNHSFSTNFLFNAKELDNETGLYYYGARYLDPTGAMWLSVDPMWEKNIDATPYNYCHGNPVTMVDPDGMDDYVKENGKFLGSSASGNKMYIIKSRADRKLIKKNWRHNHYTELSSLQNSPEALPINKPTLEASYNVLTRTEDNGGACEEISLVGKNGKEYQGQRGEAATENTNDYVTATAPSGANIPSDDEIEASIHSHPLVYFARLTSESWVLRCWSIDDPSPLDVDFFKRFNINIIVGKNGRNLTPEYNANDPINKNPTNYSDKRATGIMVYGRNIVAYEKNQGKWISRSFIENALRIGKRKKR